MLQLPTGNNSVFSNSYNKGILALTSASAGTGNFLDDENFEELEIFDQVPKKASFGVYLDGDSMEPGFKNEQLIWIEQTDTLESGDLGLFFLDGLTYFKKFVKKKSGIFLVSLNPKYKPIPVSEYLKEIICTPWEI
ncbi:Peptidase S24-like [Oribacterium sp. WCC10]|nr:Peptidase S24-like [Oribacterium sp. WCC10]